MTKDQQQGSAAIVLLKTALDTTWRMFIPVIGGTFAGIGLDHLFSIAPFATIVCMIGGVVLSAVLVVRQLTSVRNSGK